MKRRRAVDRAMRFESERRPMPTASMFFGFPQRIGNLRRHDAVCACEGAHEFNASVGCDCLSQSSFDSRGNPKVGLESAYSRYACTRLRGSPSDRNFPRALTHHIPVSQFSRSSEKRITLGSYSNCLWQSPLARDFSAALLRGALSARRRSSTASGCMTYARSNALGSSSTANGQRTASSST
jgi:hypothetical protein